MCSQNTPAVLATTSGLSDERHVWPVPSVGYRSLASLLQTCLSLRHVFSDVSSAHTAMFCVLPGPHPVPRLTWRSLCSCSCWAPLSLFVRPRIIVWGERIDCEFVRSVTAVTELWELTVVLARLTGLHMAILQH